MTCNQETLLLQLMDLQSQLKNLQDFNCSQEFDTPEEIKNCLVGRAQAMSRVNGEIAATKNQIQVCGQVNSLLDGTWNITMRDFFDQPLPDFTGQLVITGWEFFSEIMDATLFLASQVGHPIPEAVKYNPATKSITAQFTFTPGGHDIDLELSTTDPVHDEAHPPTAIGTAAGLALQEGARWSAVKREPPIAEPPAQ